MIPTSKVGLPQPNGAWSIVLWVGLLNWIVMVSTGILLIFSWQNRNACINPHFSCNIHIKRKQIKVFLSMKSENALLVLRLSTPCISHSIPLFLPVHQFFVLDPADQLCYYAATLSYYQVISSHGVLLLCDIQSWCPTTG